MIARELLRKIRRIEIRTSHLVNDALAGRYHSAFRGRGMEFEEVRPYLPGDDVRTIDWNVSARAGEPFVKVFREERELTVMLLVDLSASQLFGTRGQLKRELVAEIGATLAFSAVRNHDKIGLMLFTDAVERFVPPRKGRGHVLRVIRELLAFAPKGRSTNLPAALEHLGRVLRRRSVLFIIGDFHAAGDERALAVARRSHDVILVNVRDPAEQRLPAAGLLELEDSETGRRVVVDTSSARVRRLLEQRVTEEDEARRRRHRRAGVDTIEVRTGEPYVDALRRFFHERETRR